MATLCLSVSRLAPIKRVDLLLQALALVKTPVRCLIGGTGIDSERLQQLAARLQVQDRCQFLGFVDNESLISLYARCLAVYYAPVDEDYGLVTVEAMKAHKPVLTATDSGGTREFVVEGETGFLFEPQTPALLAQRLDELYLRRDLARRLGDRGADLVRNITWDHTIARLLED